MSENHYRLLSDGLEVMAKITPKAKQNKIIGFTAQGLKIQITATPEKGQANDAIIALLAQYCGIAKNAVQILSGKLSAHKRIRLYGDAENLLRTLQQAHQ